MSGEKVSAEIQQFIRDHINSVEQLEVLLLLSGSPDKEWTAEEISQRVYSQPASVTARLDDLCASRLVTKGQESPPRFRYAPGSIALDQTVKNLGHAYRVYKDSVITLIYSKPPDHIRAFSNAFRIRGHE